jgi:hypothetical protein
MTGTRIPLFSLALVTLSGCAQLFPTHEPAAGTSKPGDSYIVRAEQAAFYKRVPKSGRTPDLQLAKDTLLTVIHHNFAYSKVRLANGEQGFMANEDLTQTPDSSLTDSATDSESDDSLPTTPEVTLPTADSSVQAQSTSLGDGLLPQ